MSERLDYIRIAPARILDIGCGGGGDLDALGKRYPQARRVGIDFARGFLKSSDRQPGFLARPQNQQRAGAAAHLRRCPRPAVRTCPV